MVEVLAVTPLPHLNRVAGDYRPVVQREVCVPSRNSFWVAQDDAHHIRSVRSSGEQACVKYYAPSQVLPKPGMKGRVTLISSGGD